MHEKEEQVEKCEAERDHTMHHIEITVYYNVPAIRIDDDSRLSRPMYFPDYFFTI